MVAPSAPNFSHCLVVIGCVHHSRGIQVSRHERGLGKAVRVLVPQGLAACAYDCPLLLWAVQLAYCHRGHQLVPWQVHFLLDLVLYLCTQLDRQLGKGLEIVTDSCQGIFQDFVDDLLGFCDIELGKGLMGLVVLREHHEGIVVERVAVCRHLGVLVFI